MGALLFDIHDEKTQYTSNTEKLIFFVKNERLYNNGKRLKINSIALNSKTPLTLDNKLYYGDFFITYDSTLKKILVINKVPIEEYVAGVVACESFQFWPVESHKVSAIISRTFVAHKCIQSRKKKDKLYDVKADNSDQSYRGIQNYKNILQAVQETEGMVLTWKNEPIIAMYDICCGGVIPLHCSGIDFKKHPYLARSYPCNHCSSHGSYTWKIEYTHDQACKLLSVFLEKEVIELLSIHSHQHAKSGAIKKASFSITTRAKNNKKLSEKITLFNGQLRKVFSISRGSLSSCFTLTRNFKGDVVLSGKGSGHHLGLCQRGAKSQIDTGKGHREILFFYFPHTQLAHYERMD